MYTKRLLGTSLIWFCLASLVTAGQPRDQLPSVSRGPYIQLTTESSFYLVWRTENAIKPVVRFGLEPDRCVNRVLDQDITVRHAPLSQPPSADDTPGKANAKSDDTNTLFALHSAPEKSVQYEVKISGLKPHTRYYYTISDDDRLLVSGNEYFTTTHPLRGAHSAMRFWVVGDSGTGDKNQAAVYEGMRRYVEATRRPIDFYLHVGDMAYPQGTDAEFQKKFFDVYRPTLRQIPCWPAMGNHEGHTSKGVSGTGPYYDAYVCPKRGEAGGLPSASESYYSFDFANAHFVCLNSHDLDRGPAGIMAQWLRADLERTKQDWIVAFFHHPPYTKGSHDSDSEKQLIEMRELIMPILESAGVDLVLTGHSHIYERSMLIDGAYGTPTIAAGVVLDDGDGDPSGDGAYQKSPGLNPHQGVVHVVCGNGGAKVSRRGTSPVMKRVIVEHGSVIVDLDNDTLSAAMVNGSGVRRDLFTIEKKRKVWPQIVASPRLLPPYEVPKKTAAKEPSKAPGIPANAQELIAPRAAWDYLVGAHPQQIWKSFDFVPSRAEGWSEGVAGFGFGDDDDVTNLKAMKDKSTVVYIRTEFEIDGEDFNRLNDFGVSINYDDGFILYINGQEALRVGVAEGQGKAAKKVISHEAKGFEYFSLKGSIGLLQEGENLIAIEGHNVNASSSDFSLDAYLIGVMKDEVK